MICADDFIFFNAILWAGYSTWQEYCRQNNKADAAEKNNACTKEVDIERVSIRAPCLVGNR